jgi:hypothetical protein
LVEKQPVRTWCSIYVFNHSVLARGNAGLPASLYNNSLMYVCLCVCLSVCLFFPTERSDWSGTDQSGRGVLSGCQMQRSDWSGERSVPIGREPTNRDAEFLTAVKRSLPIGRGNRASSLVGNRPIKTLCAFALRRRTERPKFLAAVKRSFPIGRESTNQDAEFLVNLTQKWISRLFHIL